MPTDLLQIIESDDSSSNSDIVQKPVNYQLPALNLIPKNLEALFKTIGIDSNMTSLESMAAAQLAAFQQLQAVPDLNQLHPFYQLNPSRCHVIVSVILVDVFLR